MLAMPNMHRVKLKYDIGPHGTSVNNFAPPCSMNETANFLCATNAPTTDSASDNCGSPGKCPGSPCRLQNANLLGQPFSPGPATRRNDSSSTPFCSASPKHST